MLVTLTGQRVEGVFFFFFFFFSGNAQEMPLNLP